MKSWFLLSLTFFMSTAGASAATPVTAATVTIHRCVDGKGRVTLQDDVCAKGSVDTTREMLRPKDPPRRARAAPVAKPILPVLPPEPYIAPRELVPPPPMYHCTSYDGIERFSENYDPNPRCEPYVLYYPYPSYLTPSQALTCRWVEDSCVRLSDQAACERWKAQRKEAVSAALRAFSDTAEYRKSELARLTQIVNESCP